MKGPKSTEAIRSIKADLDPYSGRHVVALWMTDRDELCDEVDRLRAENDALRDLVARFYTQAWEDPLTPEQSDLLDSIVEADRG